jgi:hypothetical protein
MTHSSHDRFDLDASEIAYSGALRRPKLLHWAACLAMLTLFAAPSPVAAKAHLWDMLRVYSNEAGNVQFIDMFVSDPAGTAEHLFQGHLLTSNANSFVFPSNIFPTNKSTFLTWVLIATQDYADLAGAPTPDFIIPPNFFDPAGDELHYRTLIDVFVIPLGAMPTDGVLMLERDLSTPVNEGINFAGDSATVTLPPEVPALRNWGIVLAVLLLTLGAIAMLARGRVAQVG